VSDNPTVREMVSWALEGEDVGIEFNTVDEMVGDYLDAQEFDGLYNEDGECGCLAGELSPGSCMQADCRAGYMGPCDPENCVADGNCDFHVGPEKAQQKT